MEIQNIKRVPKGFDEMTIEELRQTKNKLKNDLETFEAEFEKALESKDKKRVFRIERKIEGAQRKIKRLEDLINPQTRASALNASKQKLNEVHSSVRKTNRRKAENQKTEEKRKKLSNEAKFILIIAPIVFIIFGWMVVDFITWEAIWKAIQTIWK